MQSNSQYWWLGISLIKRDLAQRYRGTALGMLWPFLYSGLLLAIFSVVFSVILRVRWTDIAGSANEKGIGALMIFGGLVPFLFVAEVLNRGSSAVTSLPNFVKKVRFPLALLPIVMVGSAIVLAAINTLILVVAVAVTTRTLHATVLLLPVLYVPLMLFALGLALFLSALGVFFRDLTQLMPLLSQILMYLAPVCYPRSIVPPRFNHYIDLNPLTWFVETMRLLVFGGAVPSLSSWLVQITVWMVFAIAGFVFFSRTRRMFADLL